MAMATTRLAPVICYEHALAQLEANLEHKSLRMSWVVVTDGDGGHRLQMRWTTPADLR